MSAGAYLAYWLFWVRGSLDLARLLIFGGPILCSVVLALLLLKRKGRTAALGASSAALTFLAFYVLANFGGCTMDGRYPIVLNVVDGRSGAELFEGNSIVMTEGKFSVKLHDVLDRMLNGVERPGTYAITVTRPGYEPWERKNVRVRRELRCGNVKTITLTAALKPTK